MGAHIDREGAGEQKPRAGSARFGVKRYRRHGGAGGNVLLEHGLEGGLRSEGGWLGHGWRCMGAHRDREGAGEQKTRAGSARFGVKRYRRHGDAARR
jgi:hypothetical protein